MGRAVLTKLSVTTMEVGEFNLGYSMGLRLTTTLGHTVTWVDDFNAEIIIDSDEIFDYIINCPGFTTRYWYKDKDDGQDIITWNVRSRPDAAFFGQCSDKAGLFDADVTVSDTNNFIVFKDAISTAFYVYMLPGNHTMQFRKVHYRPVDINIALEYQKYQYMSVPMIFKGGSIRGEIFKDGARVSGAKVELVGVNGKSKLQFISGTLGAWQGLYFFYHVPKGTYIIRASLPKVNHQTGHYTGSYNNGAAVIVATSAEFTGMDITLSSL